MKSIRDRILDLLYPLRCAFCRRFLTDEESGVCRFCKKRYNGARIERELEHIGACVAAFRYEGAVRDSLLRYKFHGVTGYGAVYAEYLAKCIDETGISCDIITWVPLSRRRLRQRGYDQARILAEETAKGWSFPVKDCWRSGSIPDHSRGSETRKSAGATPRAFMPAAHRKSSAAKGCC